MAQTLDVLWPVLRFGKPNCIAHRFDTHDDLCKASLKGIKRLSSMDYLFVIDSGGKKISLRDPQLESEIGTLVRVWAAVSGRCFPIVYRDVRVLGTVTVDELRELLFRHFDDDDYHDRWAERDLETFTALLSNARSYREIMKVVGG